jgi:CheY-like chemotaxis protein
VCLRCTIEPVPIRVSADGARLQQVVWNLLTNAIKFTPRGGDVRVQVRRVNANVELSVSDTGVGIPADFLPHVFERFSQRDSSSTRAHGGLGLGLAISRQLVELHAGTLRAASPGEGQGATFTVLLPISLIQAEEEREPASPLPEPADATPLPRLDGVHVFAVDDEPDARELLIRVLQHQGASVTAFASAQEALAALAASRPGVIVSDVGMPGMDGYQMIRVLRATESREGRIPALALTAFARSEDRKRALQAGFQAHLSKPFDVAELVLLVADLVGRRSES